MPKTELDIALENLTKEEIDILQRNSNERPFIELLAFISSGKSDIGLSYSNLKPKTVKRIISFDTFQTSTNSISNLEQENVDNNTRDTETEHSEPEFFTECQISNNISNSKQQITPSTDLSNNTSLFLDEPMKNQPITNQFLKGKSSRINLKPQFSAHKEDRMYHLQLLRRESRFVIHISVPRTLNSENV